MEQAAPMAAQSETRQVNMPELRFRNHVLGEAGIVAQADSAGHHQFPTASRCVFS